MEDPDDFRHILNMIEMDDSDIADILPEYPQSKQVPEEVAYNSGTKLAWLETILYKKLFYPFSADTGVLKIIHATTRASVFNDYFPARISLEGLSNYFVVQLTEEIMMGIKIVRYEETDDGPEAERAILCLQTFIANHPERWADLLVYIHGSLRTDVPIRVNLVHGGLPVAHTCFGILDVKPYRTPEHFARDFIYAMDNTSGLHLV